MSVPAGMGDLFYWNCSYGVAAKYPLYINNCNTS